MSIVLVRVLVDAVERTGIDRNELLRGARFDPAMLEDAATRVDFEAYEELRARAVALTHDDALGLRMAQQATEASFDLLAPLVSHAPTMREAIGLCSQFGRLVLDGANITLRERGDEATLGFELTRISPLADRFIAEFAASGVVRMIRSFSGPHMRFLAVDFEHARPAYYPEYTQVFGGAERFGQPSSGVTFDSNILDRVHLHGSSEFHLVLREEAERKLARLARELTHQERLRHYLLTQRPQAMHDMEAAARSLGTSTRSLRRHLAEEGVTFRSVVESVLEALATHMLRDPNRTIQETAHAMGFADASSFHRAFKRWKGETPKRARRATARR
jgi:AraC-like DNA-binding protein